MIYKFNSKQINNQELVRKIVFQLINAYSSGKNYKKALEFTQYYHSLADSINSKSVKQGLIKAQYQYQYDKKAIADSLKTSQEKMVISLQLDKQKAQKNYLFVILVLVAILTLFIYNRFKLTRKQKFEIEIKNNVIQKSLTEKEVLLREIHHRVKNNLQIISSLLGLQSKKLENEQQREIFIESKNKINTISLIHEKLYKSNNLSVINSEEYFTNLYASISSIHSHISHIKFSINSNNTQLDIDTCVPLGLMFNELVTNSLKYAFNNVINPEINMQMQTKPNNSIELIYEDNGCGYNDLKIKKGLGLNLVSMLSLQLNGTLKIEAENKFKITVIFDDLTKRKQTL